MKNLHSFVSDYTKDKKHLHLVIGIIREKDIEYHSFSNNKKKSMIPPENMLFEIGSITKVFTSILLLEMERENCFPRMTWLVSLCKTLKTII